MNSLLEKISSHRLLVGLSLTAFSIFLFCVAYFSAPSLFKNGIELFAYLMLPTAAFYGFFGIGITIATIFHIKEEIVINFQLGLIQAIIGLTLIFFGANFFLRIIKNPELFSNDFLIGLIFIVFGIIGIFYSIKNILPFRKHN